ncbi:TPA: hypothetical protein ACKPZ6_003824 [Serratia liquefaciens]
MTNEKEEIERLEGITPGLFSAFLSAKNAGQRCLSCGSPHIVVPETDHQTFTASLKGGSSSSAKTYVTYFKIRELKPVSTDNSEYRVICTNCGFTSYYWAHLVVNWAEKDWFPTETKDGDK